MPKIREKREDRGKQDFPAYGQDCVPILSFYLWVDILLLLRGGETVVGIYVKGVRNKLHGILQMYNESADKCS